PLSALGPDPDSLHTVAETPASSSVRAISPGKARRLSMILPANNSAPVEGPPVNRAEYSPTEGPCRIERRLRATMYRPEALWETNASGIAVSRTLPRILPRDRCNQPVPIRSGVKKCAAPLRLQNA